MRKLLLWALLLCSLSLIAGTPPGTKLTVQVSSALSGKGIDRASVIVHFTEGRNINLKKIRTTWETKTNQQGSVSIPEIPQGKITLQIIAENYQTYGNVYELNQPEQTISIKLNPPQAQYSEDVKSGEVKTRK
jgi:Flp pilus assembly secretin CpaC